MTHTLPRIHRKLGVPQAIVIVTCLAAALLPESAWSVTPFASTLEGGAKLASSLSKAIHTPTIARHPVQDSIHTRPTCAALSKYFTTVGRVIADSSDSGESAGCGIPNNLAHGIAIAPTSAT